MHGASFQYGSTISPVWHPVLGISRSLCFLHNALLQIPRQTEATQFLCYPSHWVQTLPLLDVWGSPSPFRGCTEPQVGHLVLSPFQYTVSLCSLAWAASKEKDKIILACYSFIIFWFCITKFFMFLLPGLHLTSYIRRFTVSTNFGKLLLFLQTLPSPFLPATHVH